MKHLYSKTMLNDIEETNEVHTKVENILPYLLNEKVLEILEIMNFLILQGL